MTNFKKLQILIFSIFCYNAIAQQPIVDMLDHVEMRKHFGKNGFYFKDVQGVLDPFVGTWECEYLENGINKKFVLSLIKIETFHWVGSNFSFFRDGLVYQYNIYHNNVLVLNSLTDTIPGGTIRTNDKISLIMVDHLRGSIGFSVDIQYAPVIQQGGGGQERLYFDRAAASLWNNQYFRDHPTESYSSMPTNIFLTRVD